MMCPILASGAVVEPVFVMLGLVLAAAVVVALVFARFRQSLILGYFLCGIVLANSGIVDRLGFAQTDAVFATLADTGVILLMFTLGIEFSFTALRKLHRQALGGGGLQVGVTVIAGTLAAVGLAMVGWLVAGLLGFMVALSSTALALKLFQDAGQSTGPGARLALGIALFQDVAVIAAIIVMPALFHAGGSGAVLPALGSAVGRGILFCGGAWLVTRYGIPRLLALVTATRSRELFTITVIGLCAGIASSAYAMGLSLALGAFVAGLVVSESVYSHRILADVLPFRDLFLALFFISIGLLIRIEVFLAHWWIYLLLAAVVYAGKVVIVFLAGRAVGSPVRACVQAALALGSIGEFSLVLLNKGVQMGVLDASHEQLFLILTALTMALTPVSMHVCAPLSRWLESLWLFKRHVRAEPGGSQTGIGALTGHAIICGFGPVGRRLDEALQRCGLPTVVVELNVDTVRELKALKRLVLFADAAQAETLALAGIDRAALLAVTFPHFETTRAVMAHARNLNPEVSLFSRVKFDREVEALNRIGVDCIVQDELESSVSMVRRALRLFVRPVEEIDAEEQMIRFRAGGRGEVIDGSPDPGGQPPPGEEADRSKDGCAEAV